MKRTIFFDFIRTLYDPFTAMLYPGVSGMLDELQRSGRRLILYSRKERSRGEMLKDLGIAEYFEAAYFVDQKDAEGLKQLMDAHHVEPKDCIVVGDMLDAELCAGSELGADTVWIRPQSFANALADTPVCAPTHAVSSIEELRQLLQSID